MHLTGLLVSLALLSHVSASIGLTGDLYIVDKVISPDGFSRSAVLAGGTEADASMPGPLIGCQKNDSLNIKVISATTRIMLFPLHFVTDCYVSPCVHESIQNGSYLCLRADGVKPCLIIPGDSPVCQFSAPGQVGTFWYYIRGPTQYCNGLRGPLVRYDADDPHSDLYDIDDESTVVTLADWYHHDVTILPPGGLVPTPDATLINGLGRYGDGPNSTLAVINVQPNKRYRIRLVSISCNPNYTFSVDNHTMTVIEVDGVSKDPLTADSIQIFAGQRYSFVLTTNRSVDNYWIRANPNVGTTGFSNGLNSAILRYAGAPNADPTTSQTTSTNPLSDTSLSPPITNPSVPDDPVRFSKV